MPASSTVLVSSSTNSGLPSVLATICFITSGGSTRPPVTRATMFSTSWRSRRPSVKVPTLGRPTQGGSNSGRRVNSARTGRPAALLRGAERQRRIALAERDRQQRSKKRRHAFNPRCAHGEERFQFVESLLGLIVCLETCRSLQLGDERTKRAVGVVMRTLVAQARMRRAGDALGESRRKTGLADPRLARDQHNLPFALPSEALPLQQEIELVLAADEIGQTGRADRLEATLGSRYAFDRPCRERLGNTLDLVPPEVAQTEQIAEQPARGGSEDDRPRLGQGLKVRCKVRRLPDHGALAQCTLAAQVADHYQPARDADANREQFPRARLQATGPSISLRVQAAQSLGIILHELATNASKYGALSVPAGKIMIRWDFAPKS